MIVVATGNPGKARELSRLLGVAVDALPSFVTPAETGSTYLENARIKARAARGRKPQATVIADDSGLEVAALPGELGVESARFGGPGLDDAGRVELLLDRLRDASDRSARFVCVLVAIRPDGAELIADGAVTGTIAAAPRGAGGFGYDPVFVPTGESRSFAEFDEAAKDALSHRGRACRRLAELLRA